MGSGRPARNRNTHNQGGQAVSDGPAIYTSEYRGTYAASINYRGRRIDVSISPTGRKVRVWIDQEEQKQ